MKKLPELFYICCMMMGHGQLRVRAAIHGILMNIIHSLFSIPEVADNGIQWEIGILGKREGMCDGVD